MKSKIAVILILCLSINFTYVTAQSAKNSKVKVQTTVSTGSQDREFWVSTIYKIAYPVVHNLAEGTLRKNLPLEMGPGYGGSAENVTYLEAVGRTLAGIAPWLALPDDNTKEGESRKQMRLEVLQGLKNAVDPSSPDYLNFRKYQQPIVDAAYVAQAFLRAPKALWDPLDDITKQRFIEEFKTLRDRTGAYNNWLLFAGITEAFLQKIGEQADPARMNIARYKLREWYVGDGWYSDGGKFSMDYYNDFVIHPMMVDMLKVLLEIKRIKMDEYDEALCRMIRHAEYSERIIAPDGTYPVFGRSVTYRTAAFQSLAQVALMEKLPDFIEPAQVRCALTKVFRNMYEGSQNFDKNGWLVLGFNGHQPEMADVYTSTGSLYMATLGFLPLGLPASNKFWTEAPAEWTSKKAWNGQRIKKDYKVEY
jgi:hypothetical protein